MITADTTIIAHALATARSVARQTIARDAVDKDEIRSLLRAAEQGLEALKRVEAL